MKYEFHREALEEFRQAARWYAERDTPVANKFIESVEDAIRRITEGPTRWRIVDEDIRRCLTHVFPYAILFTIEPEYLLIVAVMHCSREPGNWRSRVENKAGTELE
ncbi:MAG: plasmid stabilization protein [Acidobacteria bacterium]|nr:MAG: plasmid stabilization protein [Acidobacteriota bacterium]